MFPFGIIILLAILYGINLLLTNVFKIKFPASVLGMLINLIWLSLLNLIANLLVSRKSSSFKRKLVSSSSWILTHYLAMVRPSMNFSLKWINVFFIPSFIILPLSDHITFIECLKIAGVFVGGWIILLCIDVYFIKGFRWCFPTLGASIDSDHHPDVGDQHESSIELQSIDRSQSNPNGGGDITTIDLKSLKSTPSHHDNGGELPMSQNPFKTPSIMSELTEPPRTYLKPGEPVHRPRIEVDDEISDSQSDVSSRDSEQPATDAENDVEISPLEGLNENAKAITVFITKYIDWILYGVLFIVSLPLYYVKSIHVFLPYHLALTILAYYLALLIPQKWPWTKKFAHPILTSTVEILFVCFIGSLIFHNGQPSGFLNDLKFYRTGKTYLHLFNGQVMLNNGKELVVPVNDYTATPKWPGCGDFLASLMDISIVALSLPMFTHRRDFIKNFWVLMPPILVSIAMTYFIYPIFCYHIGIESHRSIGFIGRSVTLALGTPLINALQGSVSLMAVCTILSGICGVLVGDIMFKFLRVSPADYVTRGVSLGLNCGAIATAHLLNTDPRAASMSSLSFSIFGTIMVIISSIGAVRELIWSFVGL
jgi:putative effector of murein hydrolase